MFPFMKIGSLVVRLVAKPVINYTKKLHLAKKDEETVCQRYFLAFFQSIGQKYHRFEFRVNRKFLNINRKTDSSNPSHNIRPKPIADEKAALLGVDVFYEGLLYFLLFWLSVVEIRR